MVSSLLDQMSHLKSGLESALDQMKDFKSGLDSLQSLNNGLVKQLDSKSAHVEALQKENNQLKAQLSSTARRASKPPLPPLSNENPRTAALLIGSSHVTRLERTCDSVQVRGQSGAKIKDVTNILTKHPNNDTKTISLVIGSNDCTPDKAVDSIISDYRELIDEAHRVAKDKVTVASLLPRLTGPSYQKKADQVNSKLKDLCDVRDCSFVNNDSNFRLQNGDIDSSIFSKDKVHLAVNGLDRLVKNLGLQGKVRPKASYAQVAARPPPSRGNQSTRTNSQPTARGSRPNKPTYCWYCGESGHVTDCCRHGYRITCHRCGKPGHKQKLCRVRL